MNPFIGEIVIMANNFAPRGTAFCNGQQMSISQNTALFSLYGTTYGGNGTTTFHLPNLISRVPLGSSSDQSHGHHPPGAAGGTATVTLNGAQMPSHSHSVQCNTSPGTSNDPSGRFPAAGPRIGPRTTYVFNSAPGDAQMAPDAIGPAGGGHPHNNMQPYLTLNFCCALEGIYPSTG